MKGNMERRWFLVKRWIWRIGSAVFAAGCVLGAFWLLVHYLEENRAASISPEQRNGGEDHRKSGEDRTKQEETDQKIGETLGEEPRIRVCILGDNYQGTYHGSVTVSAPDGLRVEQVDREGKRRQSHSLSGAFWNTGDAAMSPGDWCVLSSQGGGTLVIEDLKRSQGSPEYGGSLFVYCREEGYLVVNELPLEEYLCSVVASEMPSDYPAEAQKAQAVCARTYALHCMEERRGEDFWRKAAELQGSDSGMELEKSDIFLSDLDDSVAFQVYNNQKASDASRAAVEDTAGQVLPVEDALYYSTSCGTEHREDLAADEDFRDFLLTEPEEDREYGSPWLRWQVQVPKSGILAAVRSEYGFTGDQVEQIRAAVREKNGQVTELVVSGGEETVTVSGEYSIRRVLSTEQAVILLRDGTEVRGMTLLPSAYFCIGEENAEDTVLFYGGASQEEDTALLYGGASREDTVLLYGGGYGHGQGMSQCGAAAMALKGADYREILEYYYGSDSLEEISWK